MPIFSDSRKDQERNYKKIYAIDWALANKNSQVWDGGQSRALENMVFLHLYRNRRRVHYYLTRKKRQEVDFVAVDSSGNPALAVQVCLDITQEETLHRELEGLSATANYFKTKDNLIITYNQEKNFSINGVHIKAVPAWKWMLEPSSWE